MAYVPNAETAAKIAEAVLIPVYGEKKISGQVPISRKTGKVRLVRTSAISAFARSRCAADASREVVERCLPDGLDISVGHRRYPCDPSSKNDAGGTPAS